MACQDEHFEFSGNSNPTILSRSLTIDSAPGKSTKKSYNYPSLDRSESVKKFYSSFESVTSFGNSIKGKVKKLCTLFESPKLSSSESNDLPSPSKLKSLRSIGSESRADSVTNKSSIRLPGTEDRIVIYHTTLRGIRRTYEDCYAVRLIFRGFRVVVDERDISMDTNFRKELQSVLGEKAVSLPQVFIGGKYIGGADVIKQLHEVGELAKMLKGFPVWDFGHVCESCGDVRFVPCGTCNGSRKVFDEDEEQLKRCLDCNENGLIRCPNCCS